MGQQNEPFTISIHGLKKSKKEYIERLLFAPKNQLIDSVELQNDIIRLIREPAISHAYYSLDTLSGGAVNLNYYIEENKTLIPAVDIWNTIDNQLAFHIGLTDFNFLGKGYKLGGFYRKNILGGFGILIGNPNFLNPKWGWEILLQQRNIFEPIYAGEQETFYRYFFQNAELSLLFKPQIKHQYALHLGGIKETYDKNEENTIADLPQQFKTKKFLLKGGYEFNSIQPYYYLFSGFLNRFTVNTVFGSNFSDETFFYAWKNEFIYFKRRKNRGNWANRFLLGSSKNFNTPFPAFVLDNTENIRGIGIKQKRGSALTVLNTEYRYRIWEHNKLAVQSNAFLDMASIRPAGAMASSLFNKENIYIFGGVGIRFIHKYIHGAVLRVDYGFSLKHSQRGLTFGIGQFF